LLPGRVSRAEMPAVDRVEPSAEKSDSHATERWVLTGGPQAERTRSPPPGQKNRRTP
jgi:hypothetical protein